MVADAVLYLVGIIGMRWAENIHIMRIVFRALVLVGYQHGDGRTGGFSFKHTRVDLYRIAFLALGRDLRLAGPAFVQFTLYIGHIHIQFRRAAVDNYPNSLAVRFAKSGYPE